MFVDSRVVPALFQAVYTQLGEEKLFYSCVHCVGKFSHAYTLLMHLLNRDSLGAVLSTVLTTDEAIVKVNTFKKVR